jgi:predicted  nucleic acid-binding Zn-ribbon protein
MKLTFLFLAFLLVSTTLASDFTKQAACIRDTLGKLSEAGRIHAFGIRVTNDSRIGVDSFKVGGESSKLTSKLISDSKDLTMDPKLNPVDPTVINNQRTYTYAELQVLEKDPTRHEVTGVDQKDLQKLEEKLIEHSENQKEKQILSPPDAGKAIVESGAVTKSELAETIKDLSVDIKKLDHKTPISDIIKNENPTAAIKEILSPHETSTSQISESTTEQIVIINGQKLIKKFAAEKKVLTEEIKEETEKLKEIEDKLKVITDSKQAETLQKEIEKIKLEVEKLEEKKANVTSTIRVVNETVAIANQTITQIKQEIKDATLEEIKKFGTKCTSYSIRPSIKFCAKWKASENPANKVCELWKDIYRGSKCLKHDATGKCIDTQFFFDESVDRYECESHSMEFPKDHCMLWESKNGQALCIKNETFYQAQTCVEFVVVGNEIKCGKYEGAYPAFRCIKTMKVDGKEVCQEMGAYTPNYYCKEYMMVGEHRYCKIRELFFGTETVVFECEEKEKLKDENTGEIHCMKFTAKKLDQFKDFNVVPNRSTKRLSSIVDKDNARPWTTEVKRIDKQLITEAAEVERIEKKIKELEKTIGQMSITD